MKRAALIALLLCAGSTLAHDPITTKVTFSVEIVRLFQRRCFSCHQEGGKSPMSLVKYEEARPWAKAIKEEVLERRMPPWGAVKGFGEFRHDRGLTQEEISLIADWVEGGAPEGDPKYYPELRIPEPEKPKLPATRLRFQQSLRLTASMRLAAIEPRLSGELDQVRITAQQPDGRVEPLLWLRKYKGEWKQVFVFRKPVPVSAGTVITADPPTPASFLLYAQK
ncbi:MAG: cytochrome c [Bryobacterales bacterium]|nr:cytochrome c [Bryobacterales bacterium]